MDDGIVQQLLLVSLHEQPPNTFPDQAQGTVEEVATLRALCRLSSDVQGGFKSSTNFVGLQVSTHRWIGVQGTQRGHDRAVVVIEFGDELVDVRQSLRARTQWQVPLRIVEDFTHWITDPPATDDAAFRLMVGVVQGLADSIEPIHDMWKPLCRRHCERMHELVAEDVCSVRPIGSSVVGEDAMSSL